MGKTGLTSTRSKFYTQQNHAKRRGIEWKLTFEEWLLWWGEDLDKRGRGFGKLQMCRIGDEGPYSLGNIYKGTHNHNSSYKYELGFKAKPKYIDSEGIKRIQTLLEEGQSTRKIAELVGINQKTVMRIKHNKY